MERSLRRSAWEKMSLIRQAWRLEGEGGREKGQKGRGKGQGERTVSSLPVSASSIEEVSSLILVVMDSSSLADLVTAACFCSSLSTCSIQMSMRRGKAGRYGEEEDVRQHRRRMGMTRNLLVMSIGGDAS